MEQTLGKRIMQNRKRLGLTQDQLADKLGVTAQAVSKWENDQSCPDISTLPKLAEIFGITVDELLGRTTAQPVHETDVLDDEETEREGIHIQKDGFEFQWDDGKDTGKKHATAFAILVLAVGCLTLASRLLRWDVSFWEILWPTALLVFGLTGLLSRFSFFCLGCGIFGGYFLLTNLGVLNLKLGTELVFPVILVLFGISLLVDALRKKRKKHHVHVNRKSDHKHTGECSTTGESFTCSTAFGEDTQYITLPKLTHGSAEVSFGELTVDLSHVDSVSDGCVLDLDCSFGELILRIPRRYYADPSRSTAFASVSIQGQPDSNPAGTIHINADVSFGQISIRYI